MAAPDKVKDAIVEDTGWVAKSGGRCITDYSRVIKFNRELKDEEMDSVMTWVRTELYPGWTATPEVKSTRELSKTGAWKFESTVDTSD